ncbi:MAG: S9 family peptidase [Ktedonobacteraceae bacterium]|nr:S9 family peptidase [Ktedonobacteraceae bacterium]
MTTSSPKGPIVAPYGSWISSITTDLIVSDTIRLGLLTLDGEDIYWIEGRPSEGGRNVIVQRKGDGTVIDITPAGFNARTRVHEYGGGDFTVHNGTVYFANFVDQRLYRQAPGSEPEPMTPAGQLRFADMVVDQPRGRLICVCEDHSDTGREATNKLVGVPLEGDGDIQILSEGYDFYASPRLSPDGKRLCWQSWNHPNMPWDGCELCVGELDDHGLVSRATRVAGGLQESIFQPEWSPDGVLHFISDRTGWWNLYHWHNGAVEPLYERDAEFGRPQWVFGLSTYSFVAPDRLICWYGDKEGSHLAYLSTGTLPAQLTPIDLPYTSMNNIRASISGGYVIFIGATPTSAAAVVRLDLASGRYEEVRSTSSIKLDPSLISVAQAIEFPTNGGLTAYAYYYAPHNPDYRAPEDEKPPLLVISHGGPTSATASMLSLGIQYWTSRGFAVLDVNYGGSAGYGRAYRERLKGQWGVVDVHDCSNGALYLVERGLADRQRLAIRGGSAGGYTTLCALVFLQTFQAGASHFGVSDLGMLVRDTHKFESRYLFSLIGPYPEQQELYQQRSPINHTHRLYCPIIFFQGLEDRVVPPNQAESMVEALKNKKLPVAYVAFEGEQHGFRRAENIKRSLEAELYFYGRVFNFKLAESVEPVEIENLPSPPSS